MRLALTILMAAGLGAGFGNAQQVVSAHSGVVHYTEGKVFVGDQPVERKFGVFPDLQVGEQLRTGEDGRAEVLLMPGAFLRVAENSSVRMLSRDLTDTRFEVLSGSVMVECDDLPKSSALTLVYQGRNIQLEKQGLYRLDTAPGKFQVFSGKAVVPSDAGPLTLKNGKETDLTSVLLARKFNPKTPDEFVAGNSSLWIYRLGERLRGPVGNQQRHDVAFERLAVGSVVRIIHLRAGRRCPLQPLGMGFLESGDGVLCAHTNLRWLLFRLSIRRVCRRNRSRQKLHSGYRHCRNTSGQWVFSRSDCGRRSAPGRFWWRGAWPWVRQYGSRSGWIRRWSGTERWRL